MQTQFAYQRPRRCSPPTLRLPLGGGLAFTVSVHSRRPAKNFVRFALISRTGWLSSLRRSRRGISQFQPESCCILESHALAASGMAVPGRASDIVGGNLLMPVDPHLWGCGRQSSPGILEPSASAWHQQLQPMGLLPIETRRARTRKSFADRRREPISTFGLERRCRATCILWQHGHRAAWRFRWASRPLPENLRAFSFPCGFAWSSAGGYLNRTESKLSHASC